MTRHCLIWICCFIGTVVCSLFSRIQSDSIASSAWLGEFIDIRQDVTIKELATVGPFCSIGAHSVIEKHAVVGSYSHISDNCYIGEWVNIQGFTNVGSDSSIGSGSNLNSYCAIGQNSRIGSMVTISGYSNVASRVEVGDFSILDEYSAVGNGAKFMSKTYLGKFSVVEPNAFVGESAVIQKFVKIPSGTVVKPNEVYIRTPSSFEMYSMCDPDFSNMQAQSPTNEAGISTEFDNGMRELIEKQMDILAKNCAQNNNPMKPTYLPQIISSYLSQYHGIESFKKYVQQVKQACNGNFGGNTMIVNGVNVNGMNIGGGEVYINGVRMTPSQSTDSSISQLKNEYHFGENSPKRILSRDVENKLIQLLAIDQDVGRDKRDKNDTPCTMLQQIQSLLREVKCAPPSGVNQQC